MGTSARLVACGAVLLASGASAGVAASDSVLRAQLDGDPPLETLMTEMVNGARCGATSTCSRLLLIDGRRRVALSTIRQRDEPKSYKWRIASVRAIDLTGDGIRDVMWKQETVGATATSPVLFAVSRWDGRTVRRLFTLRIRRRPAPGYYASLPLSVRVKPSNGSARELRTTEALYRSGDSDCCPSALRRRSYRWNGQRIALVPNSTRVTPAPRP